MDELKTLISHSFSWPSPSYLIGSIFFGLIGYVAYVYGRKAALPRPKWIGIVMMVYPYATPDTRLMYACGAGLCAMLYVFRK